MKRINIIGSDVAAGNPIGGRTWPSDAIMIVASNAGQEVVANIESVVPVACRDCEQPLHADSKTIRRAEELPARADRPIKFFCIRYPVFVFLQHQHHQRVLRRSGRGPMNTAIMIIAAGIIGGWASAAIVRWRHDKWLAEELDRQKTEHLRLVRAEYQHWVGQTADAGQWNDSVQRASAYGGESATSNLIAALMGHPAPWHVHRPSPAEKVNQ